MGDFFISASDLQPLAGCMDWPQVIDVRRHPAFEASQVMLPAARWGDHMALPDWAGALDPTRPVVIYCLHGEQVSQSCVARLRAEGFDARVLSGGIDGWIEAGGPLRRKASLESSPVVLPLRPGSAQIAAAWLWRRFADPEACFLHVEAAQVAAVADELDLAETPDFATLHRRLFDAAAPHSLQADLPDRARSEGLLLPEILEAAYLCREDEGKALDAAFAMMDALYARMRAGTGESGA